MRTSFTSRSREETSALGERIASSLRGGELLLLSGDLGAGKTEFVRGLAAGLECAESVSSPTFVLEHVYHGRLTLVHADLYRLADHPRVPDLALEEAVVSGAVAAVEWGEKLETLDRGEAIRISIRIGPDENDREIEIEDPRS